MDFIKMIEITGNSNVSKKKINKRSNLTLIVLIFLAGMAIGALGAVLFVKNSKKDSSLNKVEEKPVSDLKDPSSMKDNGFQVLNETSASKKADLNAFKETSETPRADIVNSKSQKKILDDVEYKNNVLIEKVNEFQYQENNLNSKLKEFAEILDIELNENIFKAIAEKIEYLITISNEYQQVEEDYSNLLERMKKLDEEYKKTDKLNEIRFSELLKKNEVLEKEITHLREELANANKEKEVISNELQQLKIDHTTVMGENISLDTQNFKLLESSIKIHKEDMKTIEELTTTIKELQNEVLKLKESSKLSGVILENKTIDFNGQLENFKYQVEYPLKNIEKLELDNNKSNIEIKNLNENIIRLTNNMTEKEKTINDNALKIKKLEKDNNDYNVKNTELMLDILQLEDSFNNDTKFKNLKNENQELMSKILELEKKLKTKSNNN